MDLSLMIFGTILETGGAQMAGAAACGRPAHLLSCSVGSRLHHRVLVISLLARFAQISKCDAKMTEQFTNWTRFPFAQ